MSQKFTLNGVEYDLETLSDNAKVTFASLQFVSTQLQELTNLQAIFNRAKNSYVDSLKKELLSNKAGFLFDDD